MNKEKILIKKLPGLRLHEVMRDHTTMKVGGVADFYFEAKNIDELVKTVKTAQKIKMPFIVLGGGSNIIFSDFGFPGLVIKNSTANLAFMSEKSQAIVDSGVSLSKLILEATSHNLSGLEFLYGLPGSIGGAVYGNAGAYGQAIGDFIKYATLLFPSDKNDFQILQVPGNWFAFGYRSSQLKKMEGLKKPVILTLRIQLAQNRQEEIMRRLNLYKEKRMSTQPLGQSAGCVFKNPIPQELKNVPGAGSINMPELPKERTAGYMLEKAGAKKLKIGNARVSAKHANFILNTDGAKAQDVRQFIEKMRRAVRDKFNITLEEEIEYVGQW